MPENSCKTDDPRPINALPPELLGQVFIFGTEEYRSFRKPFSKRIGFQDIVIQVCRHWREVGLRMPELWASVFVSQPPSYQRAELYLARVGPTYPLDIEVAIPGPDSEDAIEWAHEMLEYVISHGGNISRWRSLTARAKNPEALFVVVGLVNSSPAPALQFISLKRWFKPTFDGRQEEDTMQVAQSVLEESYSLSGGPQCPQLSRVELMGLTSGFIFNRASPLASNLRHLKLSCSRDFYPAHSIGELLSASPQLESLCLDVGAARYSDMEGSETAPPKVFLPSLRSFSLRVFGFSQWGKPLLQMIDAPAVESLRLSCKGGGLQPMLRFLCKGRLYSDLRPQSSTSTTRHGPIYPSLRRLHLDSIDMSEEDWDRLTDACCTITEITLDWIGLLDFGNMESVMPSLSHIRYSGDRPEWIRIWSIVSKYRALPRVSILRRGTQEGMNNKCKDLRKLLEGLVDQVGVYDDNDDFDREFD